MLFSQNYNNFSYTKKKTKISRLTKIKQFYTEYKHLGYWVLQIGRMNVEWLEMTWLIQLGQLHFLWMFRAKFKHIRKKKKRKKEKKRKKKKTQEEL